MKKLTKISSASLLVLSALFISEDSKAVMAGPFGRCGKTIEVIDGGKLEGYMCIYHMFACECDRRNFEN